MKAFIAALLMCGLCFAGEIDRKRFSVTVPDGWREDTSDAAYQADTCVLLTKRLGAEFTVLIGRKTSDDSLAKMLDLQ